MAAKKEETPQDQSQQPEEGTNPISMGTSEGGTIQTNKEAGEALPFVNNITSDAPPPPDWYTFTGTESKPQVEPTYVVNSPQTPVQVQSQVSLQRTKLIPTEDLMLWVVINNSTNAISFNEYQNFINTAFNNPCASGKLPPHSYHPVSTPFTRIRDYNVLKAATEVFLMDKCGVLLEGINLDESNTNLNQSSSYLKITPEISMNYPELEKLTPAEINNKWQSYLANVYPSQDNGPQTIPYLDLIKSRLRDVQIIDPIAGNQAAEYYGILLNKLTNPCFIELIWSYWHEEGMLCQALNAICLRFQNRLSVCGKNPLAHLNIDPLRTLNNVFWGYIQDEQHRLSLLRRAYEYDHHYGLTLYGKAVSQMRSADSRSKFIEAFHNLLHLCSIYYRDEDDTTVIADAFPILDSLREVHMLLAQGAHNQYGDLPWVARTEMLMQQWILAQPEMREFLGQRVMVPYPEPWMDRIDTLKTLFSWSDVPITHFNYLARYGEQILLSIRFGNWSIIETRENAANWARLWRSQVQGYIHNYRAVTGVDLASEVSSVMPSDLLRRRLQEQMAGTARRRR